MTHGSEQPFFRSVAGSGVPSGGLDTESRFQEAVALHQQSRLAEAESRYLRVLESEPQHARALNLLGVIALQTQQPTRAVELITKSITIEPRNFAAHVNLGNALCELGRFEIALESYEKAVELNPHAPQVYNNRGNALRELKRHDAALASYEKALALDARYADAHVNRGIVLSELNRPVESLRSHDAAIALEPGNAQAWHGRGDALRGLRRHEPAVASYQRAIALRPSHADYYNSMGIALAEAHQYASAVGCYDRGLTFALDNADLHNNRGNALRSLRQYEAAARSYDAAHRLEPGLPGLAGVRIHTRMQLCEWAGLEGDLTDLIARIARAETSNPCLVLALTDSAALQKVAAQIASAQPRQALIAGTAAHRTTSGLKIRVGYFSADFHCHATSYLLAELLEVHDRARFEILAFSYGRDSQDEMRLRIASSCDRFIDVRSQSDAEIAQLSRTLGLHIAVDLKGFTRGHRLGIFAQRAAPVQISYLGYPGTSGAPYMDYLIADRTVIPEESRDHYTEKIIYLPDSYQVNDSRRRIGAGTLARSDCDLPESGFVFCCFNNNYKITPQVFEVWMRILDRVPDSVLWLFEGSPAAARNLRREAERQGIDARRLIFAKYLSLDDHLARHRLADLFLDTLPCNAHTTASDALWAGLPVLTCTGEAFASRVAASLLKAVGLPELITSNPGEYEARAVALASPDSKELSGFRERLSRNRLSTPLFDTQRFRRNLEDAFLTVCDRYEAGLPPEHIDVAGG